MKKLFLLVAATCSLSALAEQRLVAQHLKLDGQAREARALRLKPVAKVQLLDASAAARPAEALKPVETRRPVKRK